MIKQLLLISIFMLSNAGFVQETSKSAETNTTEPIKVTINVRGTDVRDALHTLFTQAKADYVIDGNVRTTIYLSLTDAAFENALNIICETANIEYKIIDGIYRISNKPKPTAAASEAKTEEPSKTPAVDPLTKIVSINAVKMPINDVLALLGEQSGVKIILEQGVPEYLVSIAIKDKPLKFALTAITSAVPLTFAVQADKTIKIQNKTTTIESSKAVAPAKTAASEELKCKTCGKHLEKEWRWCPFCGRYLKAK